MNRFSISFICELLMLPISVRFRIEDFEKINQNKTKCQNDIIASNSYVGHTLSKPSSDCCKKIETKISGNENHV